MDKEFLRLWFRQNCDPYNDEVWSPDLMLTSMPACLPASWTCRVGGGAASLGYRA